MTVGVAQGGQQVGVFGAQPGPGCVRVRQCRGMGRAGPGGREPGNGGDQRVGAARGVLVVVQEPVEGGVAGGRWVMVSQDVGVQPDQVV